MAILKSDIINNLKKDILALQGFKSVSNNVPVDSTLGPITKAFPNSHFPLGAIHEFISHGSEDAAVTGGFIAVLIASITRNRNHAIWISASRNIFPPALKSFGMDPGKIIFIDLKKEKEILWTVEQALKCKGISAVVCELQELNFTASRRLQLAVEQSQVTGFIHRCNPRNLNTTASVTRWKITTMPAEQSNDIPGVGFPRWNVRLLRVRNGQPDNWQIEFVGGRLKHAVKIASIDLEQQRKAV